MANEARSGPAPDPPEMSVRVEHGRSDLRYASSGSNRLPPEPLCDELQRAVEGAAVKSAASMKALRAAVCRFTAALKDDGASPESVLISIKSVINSRTFPVMHGLENEWTPGDLQQQISTWAIKEFFSETHA